MNEINNKKITDMYSFDYELSMYKKIFVHVSDKYKKFIMDKIKSEREILNEIMLEEVRANEIRNKKKDDKIDKMSFDKRSLNINHL